MLHVVQYHLKLQTGVVKIYNSQGAWAALKNDGSVVCFGETARGGNCTSVDFTWRFNNKGCNRQFLCNQDH